MENNDENIPSYITKPKTTKIGNVSAEDFIWTGLSGELDPEEIIRAEGYDLTDPLSDILGAIIDANPTGSGTREERLEEALKALVGARRNPGMDPIDEDYGLLIQISREYLRRFFDNGRVEPPFAPIADKVIGLVPPGDPRRLAGHDSVIRRLRRKFQKNKDTLLVRASSDQNWDRMDFRRSVQEIISKMRALRIRI